MELSKQIETFLKRSSNTTRDVAARYRERLAEGALTKDENPTSHFCAYFLPFDKGSGKLLIGNHKKSGKWLSPGGHVDNGEDLLGTLNREIEEELGVRNFFKELADPFLFTVTDIDSDPRGCKYHFDVWFLLETDGKDFAVDMAEYHAVKWMMPEEALAATTDPANRQAYQILITTQRI